MFFLSFKRAKNQLDSHVKQMDDWKDFCKELNHKNLILAPFCGEPSCEDNIKADSARYVIEKIYLEKKTKENFLIFSFVIQRRRRRTRGIINGRKESLYSF